MAKTKAVGLLTALYERLSRDDEQQGESNSISNQKDYLEDYARKNGFSNFKHYTDDGFSGTNFKRPGFQKMLDDIEDNKIGTVIVKDMSRFGRNYLQVGFYTDIMFPKKGVRFIAINSNVDSESENPNQNDFAPFLNIMNEWYAKDTSNKIKTIFDNRMRAGKRCCGNAPYGYVLSPEDRQTLIVDPASAKVVKHIFELMADGKNTAEIARILTEEKIVVPSVHINQLTGRRGAPGIQCKDPFKWNHNSVLDILNRQEYLGHTILKKTVNVNFKTRLRKRTDKDEQYFFPNTHEPIISEELWEKAHKNIKIVTRKRINDEIKASAVFLGLLYCSDCGSKLIVKLAENDKTGSQIIAYHCNRYSGYSGKCSPHYINEKDLKSLLLEYLRVIGKKIIEDEEGFINHLNEKLNRERNDAPNKIKSEIKAYKQRLEELDKLIGSLYENFVSGLLPQKQYKTLMQKYSVEQEELEVKTKELNEDLEKPKNIQINPEEFVNLIKKYKEPVEITRDMVRALVDRIIIYSPVGKKPNRTQQIDVYFNFIGKYDLEYTAQELEEKRLQAEKEMQEKAARIEKRKKDYHRARYEKTRAERIAANGGHWCATQICPICNEEFEPFKAGTTYCSDKCRAEASHRQTKLRREKLKAENPIVEIPCKICGKPFMPSNRQQFLCSDECRKINRKQVRKKYEEALKCKNLSKMKEPELNTSLTETSTIQSLKTNSLPKNVRRSQNTGAYARNI